ncbi:MAG TPA: class I SAM-dependent methyltransferase [Acidimicrobiales bacterium]
MSGLPRAEAEAWLESWDRQQERYLPDREERFGYLTALVCVAPPDRALRVLDLACGPGSLTKRILAVRADAEIVAVDLDPALLAIYRSLNPEVLVVEADLRRSGWSEAAGGEFDAVVTATALHWLSGPEVRRLYAELFRKLRSGGVFLNADHAPLDGSPDLARRCADVLNGEIDALPGERHDWESWWSRMHEDLVLGPLVAERNRRFADRGDEFAPPEDWHLSALADAGFAECAVVWRRGRDAIIAAVR